MLAGPDKCRSMNLPELFAYIGEDELGSGVVGLKQAVVAAGLCPMVCTAAHRYKLEREGVRRQLEAQAKESGMPIRFVRYVPVEEVWITPST